MTDREIISAWLERIGETDQLCIDIVLRQCTESREAREYYKKWATGTYDASKVYGNN